MPRISPRTTMMMAAGLATALSVSLMFIGCASGDKSGGHLKNDSRKGATITSTPNSRGDQVGEAAIVDRPVTIDTTSKPSVPPSSTENSGDTAGSDGAAVADGDGNARPSQPRRPRANTGPRLGGGRSMDDGDVAVSTDGSTTSTTPTSPPPKPIATSSTSPRTGATPRSVSDLKVVPSTATTDRPSAVPVPGDAEAEAKKADEALVARVRALAFKSFADGAYSTAIELASEVVANTDSDADAHLLIARAAAAEYPKHAGDAETQDDLAQDAADAARNAWKHGKQDLATYQGADFANLVAAPAWIGVIGELKARDERRAAGK